MVSRAEMQLGTNFWNLNWHSSSDCFNDVKNVSGDDPWNPQFLKDIAIYNCLRFMDWDVTNGSPRQTWQQRPHKAEPKQNPVAYEWMIDLCNRMNADMWVCIPHMTVSHSTGDEPCDYALRLAILLKTGIDMKEVDLKPLMPKLATMTPEDFIKAGGERTTPPLKPERKIYFEYSNETWNGMFKQTHYCLAEGTAVNLDPSGKTNDKGENWSNAFRFHAWAALRVFRAVEMVFGKDNPRVEKVLAEQAGQTHIAAQHLIVMNDAKMNPWGIKATSMAAAPYFGRNVNGSAPDAAAQLREAINKSVEGSEKLKALADGAGLKLVAYEGGQHVINQARAINKSQEMYGLYTEYLAAMSKYYTEFCHYAHVGKAGEKGCWGCMEVTGQPIADAPKYRALTEYSAKHNAPKSGTAK